MDNYVGKEITDSIFLVAKYNKYSKEYDFELSTYDYRKSSDEYYKDYAVLDEVQVTIIVPDVQLEQITISRLREEQSKIQANAQLKVNEIEEQIQSMLCLEYSGDCDD